MITNGETNGFFDTAESGTSSSGVTVTMPAPTDAGYDSSLSKAINPGGISDQSPIAPAPSAPAGSTDLGSISLSGNAKLVIRDGPVDIPAGQSLSNLTSGTANIPPGDYKISSLDVSGSSSIQVDGTLSQPASFYIDNVSSGNSAVNIGGAGVTNGTSGNLQLWYNGTNALNVNGTNSTLSVYAPNASIKLSGNFKGALVGSSVDVANANLDLETPVASTQSKSGSMFYSSTSQNGKPQIKPHGLKKVAWQELSYSDYIKQGNAPF